MSKIAVKFDHYFIADASKIPAILEALANGELYEASGWGVDKSTVFTKCEHRPLVYFVEDTQFAEPPEPLVALQEQLRQSEQRWISYYNEANAAKKEVAELKEKLAVIQGAAQ